jgi:trehalose/maltose hydrolase-like predicted phosphorylase
LTHVAEYKDLVVKKLLSEYKDLVAKNVLHNTSYTNIICKINLKVAASVLDLPHLSNKFEATSL